MLRPIRRYQLVVDVVLAALFAVVALPIELRLNPSIPFSALSAVLVVVSMTAALAVRRLSPGLSLGIAWAGAIMQMAFGRSPNYVDLAIFGVLYVTAAYGSRRVFWAGFASVIVGATVITLYIFLPVFGGGGLGLSSLTTALATLLAALFGLGLAWTIGALVRTGLRARETRRAQELAETAAVTEAERTRIARDMHDVVAHSLAVVIAQADGARYAAAADPNAVTDALGTISSTARAALADVRLLLTQLRHSQADGPQPTLADLEQVYAQVRAAGVDLRVDVDPAPRVEPPASAQLAVYRILQEALTNALRHGHGGAVEVAIAWHPDRVQLQVRNPVSSSPRPEDASRGHGLIGMRERAQLVGGSLDAAVEGAFFVVRATLPIGGAA